MPVRRIALLLILGILAACHNPVAGPQAVTQDVRFDALETYPGAAGQEPGEVTGLLTLPYALLFGSLIWWLILGAPKHPSTSWLWTFYVGVGLIAAELLALLVAVVVSR